MKKKNKTIKIALPSVQIAVKDIFKVLGIIKKNRLGNIKLLDKKGKIINLRKTSLEIIYELIIEVSSRENKNDFKIIFTRSESNLEYFEEIDSEILTHILNISNIIRKSKVAFIPKKVNYNIQTINYLILMGLLSINPLIKNKKITNPLIIGLAIGYFLFFMTIFFYNFHGHSRIIIKIKNRFKRFYYRYYSISNTVRAILFSSVFIFIMFLIYRYIPSIFKK